MIGTVSSLFGFATTVANARASLIGLSSIRERLCTAFVLAFGYSQIYGQSIYQQVKNNEEISSVNGLGNSTYNNIEQQVYAILNAAFPDESDKNKKILALSANALIFSYHTFNSIDIKSVIGLMGQVMFYTAANVTGHQIFSADKFGFVSTPFNEENISNLLNNDYDTVIQEISNSSKNSFTEVVNYNWFEMADVFATPNLQLMKDVENQYYYVSGQLLYQSETDGLPDCFSETINLNTITGQIQTSYIVNQPCIDRAKYIGPVTGVSFYRVFNDGPYSSGDFNDDVKNAYIGFDKSVLQTGDYDSNSKILYSFETGSDGQFLPIAFQNVFLDSNGIYNLNEEYSHLGDGYGCSHIYTSMHIGNNGARIICDRNEFNQCVNCRPFETTGYKFASLELNEQTWLSKYNYLKSNPYSAPKRALKRGLNLLPYSYVSQLNENDFTAIGGNGQLCLGYPQLTGQTAIPNIAFFQNFDSPSFHKNPSLVMYASIGTSNNGDGGDSDRNYQISQTPLFSGRTFTSVPLGQTGVSVIPFTFEVSSNYISGDDVTKQFFGMGDNFGNQYVISEAQASNAGFVYSGYLITGSGIYENLTLFNNQFTANILGSPVKNINYVSGYSDMGGRKYLISKMFAQDSGSGLIAYYYLDNNQLPDALQVQENQLYSFSPLPYVFETNSNLYNRISGTQEVENFFPRYSQGAFSNQIETFLYPNAKIADTKYNSRQNGFPLRISFVLNIREESVRELFGRYFITNDGLISSSPYYVNVVRPTENNTIDMGLATPLMNQMFTVNNIYYQQEYDFNNFSMNDSFFHTADLSSLVDNNWSPYINRSFSPDGLGGLIKNFNQTNHLNQFTNEYYTPSGKNSSFYDNSSNPFYQGVRLTGNGVDTHVGFTGTGNADYFTFYSEKPFSNGLFHYYQTRQITGYLLYTKPYFDLSSGSGYINDAIKEAFYVMVDNHANIGGNCGSNNDPGCATVENSYVVSSSGTTGTISEGVDPIFLKYMGGRLNGFLTEQEGGYHPKGIIGDQWNNFSYERYGMQGYAQFAPCNPPTRWAYYDKNLILLNGTSDNLNIFTRALNYNPVVIPQKVFQPFNKSESYPYTLNGGGGSITMTFSGDYGTFSLRNYMPVKTMTGAGWYDPNGILIGPFDREIEVGVLGGNRLYSNGDIYCSGNQISDSSGFGGCDQNAQLYGRNQLNSGIIPNEYGRSADFTIFTVIPKNGYLNINLYAQGAGNIGFANSTGVSGVTITNSRISLRPRKMIGASLYDSRIHKGEEAWINPLMFLNNGLEKQYNLPINQFEDLESQVHTYISYTNSGKLYPVPGTDFTGLATIDDNGNYIYPESANVESYWKRYAIKNNQTIVVSGWRESSRVSFEFTDIQVDYDRMPYQENKIIIPSGKCIISGSMGYVKQADASIFSAGIVLNDATDPIANSFEEYQPSFISNVLERLPIYNQLSGDLPEPVFVAPSLMIQRKNVDVISGNQVYNKLFNYPPYDYNKFAWQAFSDLEILNEGETLEANIPNDPITFNQSALVFSAAQGQPLPNGLNNPSIDKTFDVTGAFQMYDSIATDALVNSGICITQNRGTEVRIKQSTSLSGILTPIGTSLSMIKNGLS